MIVLLWVCTIPGFLVLNSEAAGVGNIYIFYFAMKR